VASTVFAPRRRWSCTNRQARPIRRVGSPATATKRRCDRPRVARRRMTVGAVASRAPVKFPAGNCEARLPSQGRAKQGLSNRGTGQHRKAKGGVLERQSVAAPRKRPKRERGRATHQGQSRDMQCLPRNAPVYEGSRGAASVCRRKNPSERRRRDSLPRANASLGPDQARDQIPWSPRA
jgi:hypothetical protein